MARPTSPGQEPAGPSSAASPPHGPPSVALAEYESRKAHTPDTAVAQARLARWCDEHDLKDEARAHWEAVTRLNPKGETAWKRLGYKKHHNRWMTDAMIADEAEQAHADRRWKKVLEDLHKRLHAKGPDAPAKRDAVEAELARVDDPRAAPMLWQVFAGDAGHHLLLAGLLRRLESPRSSRMLAALAVYSRDAKARHAAFEALRGRDPSEFAEPLIALLGPPLKYRITAVPGQGRTSAKALEVEDERVNRQFIYVVPKGGASGADDPFGGCSNTLGTRGVGWTAQGRQLARALNAAESRKAEAAAEMQLQSDIAAVEAINTSIREMNDRVVALLTATSRVDHGADREAWRRWLAERQDRPYSPPEEAPKLTIAQLVPPIYRPTFIDVPAPS
jgi:hypothetical protein